MVSKHSFILCGTKMELKQLQYKLGHKEASASAHSRQSSQGILQVTKDPGVSGRTEKTLISRLVFAGHPCSLVGHICKLENTGLSQLRLVI